ncbi:glycosyltransferase [Lasius niger]|uniref:Glycosyltransferase n=1 Tax=Lasius niger TaxID=67767 RepID=A0A0J7KT12_LASNI|nr:glycosyltransferase [Lasius niger]
MKWFFAMTQQALTQDLNKPKGLRKGFADCIRVAVNSAKEKTSLQPHMIFDGAECDFTREMEACGVKVIFHRLSWYDRLQAAQKQSKPEWDTYMEKAAGSFLRLEIPLLEDEDQYVLYTDCDILFLNGVDLSACRPETFAVAGQFSEKNSVTDINAGVTLLNLDRLREDLPAMIDFMCQNFSEISGFDQELLRGFYHKNWSRLDPKYNWKPYWGINKDAVILHFYAGKPDTGCLLLQDPSYGAGGEALEEARYWFFQNPEGYAYYLPLWERYRTQHTIANDDTYLEEEIALFDAARHS